MPTIGEAATLLRVGRVTLEKWMKRLGITPERHPQDWRFYTITSDDLERIADARRQMPGKMSHPTPAHVPTYARNALRAKSDVSRDREASVRRPHDATPLPDGMMGKQEAASRHGVPLSTLIRWIREGKIETDSGEYGGEHGQFSIHQPITRRGLAQLYALASHRPDFRRCDDCPHDEA